MVESNGIKYFTKSELSGLTMETLVSEFPVGHYFYFLDNVEDTDFWSEELLEVIGHKYNPVPAGSDLNPCIIYKNKNGKNSNVWPGYVGYAVQENRMDKLSKILKDV